MPGLILVKAELSLSTRRQRHIRNEMKREPPVDGALIQVQHYVKQYKSAIHRDEVGPCNTFNCHGLTFAARRTSVEAADVPLILTDDDYIEVRDKKKVKPGDIAIFRKNGEITHSGIVVEVDELRGPRLLSKWGFLHEVIHYPFEGPYSECEVTYHRVTQ